ncbi:MAG: glycine/sarcosine/betaine reductase component B subunit [Synergistales bacterium]
MKLEFRKIQVHGLEWADKTTVKDGVLYINREEATKACGEYPVLEGITLHLARPGENVRILPVKAAVEPRCKVTEEGSMFPGIVGRIAQAGIGTTLALKGAAVLVTENNDSEVKCRTGALVDMSGPGADYTPFSSTFNIVLNARVNRQAMGRETLTTDEACRIAGFRLAVYLADCCKNLKADSSNNYELPEADPELPGVVYVLQLLAQNPEIIDFHVYGQLAGSHFIPTLVHPNELLDGGVTTFLGSHCTVCADKQYMYEVQNSPVVERLYQEHGKTLRFLGVVVHNEVLTFQGKERSSLFTVNLAKKLGARGAILVTEGHGNPDEDIMLNVEGLERAGISTVIISDELGGRDGRSPGLADWVPECDAMVSVGNMHEILAVPKEQKVLIGNEGSMDIVRALVEQPPEDRDSFYIELKDIPLACAQAGLTRLSARWA